MTDAGRHASTIARGGFEEPITAQQSYWNQWNSMFLDHQRGPVSQRQAQVVEGWLERWGRRDLDVLEVGCGSGWMCGRLQAYGKVTGTDLSDEVLKAAQQKIPAVRFVAGDFMQMALAENSADVIVTLEVLSHVADQPAFIDRIARTLRPGGQLMIATQNRFVLERWEEVQPRAQGQIRHWLRPAELRALLQRSLVVEELFTVVPFAHGGVLRIVNSTKLNRLASMAVPQTTLDRWKERCGLGHTIMALARKR